MAQGVCSAYPWVQEYQVYSSSISSSSSSGGPAIVPVALYIACKIAWHSWGQPAVAVRGVAPVAGWQITKLWCCIIWRNRPLLLHTKTHTETNNRLSD